MRAKEAWPFWFTPCELHCCLVSIKLCVNQTTTALPDSPSGVNQTTTAHPDSPSGICKGQTSLWEPLSYSKVMFLPPLSCLTASIPCKQPLKSASVLLGSGMSAKKVHLQALIHRLEFSDVEAGMLQVQSLIMIYLLLSLIPQVVIPCPLLWET